MTYHLHRQGKLKRAVQYVVVRYGRNRSRILSHPARSGDRLAILSRVRIGTVPHPWIQPAPHITVPCTTCASDVGDDHDAPVVLDRYRNYLVKTQLSAADDALYRHFRGRMLRDYSAGPWDQTDPLHMCVEGSALPVQTASCAWKTSHTSPKRFAVSCSSDGYACASWDTTPFDHSAIQDLTVAVSLASRERDWPNVHFHWPCRIREHANRGATLSARLSSGLGSLLVAPDGISLVPAGTHNNAWRSLGPDTRFNIDRIDHAVIPAGWHVLRLRWRALEGDIMAPALYPDYGNGFLAEEAIVLPQPDAAGSLERLVLFKHPVQRLQFRPTWRCAEFALDSFELERVSRANALWKMLRALGRRVDADGSAPGFWPALGEVTRVLMRRGVSAAAGVLFQRYGGQPEITIGSYGDWVRQYDDLGPSDLVALDIRARELQNPPLISILLPVYNTPERWLRRCIDSVLAQAYPHWELCVADDASPAPHVQALLQEYASKDQRIRVSRREQNGHISAASNTALDMATGEFIALLDHDDELRPHALLEVAEAIGKDPDLAFLYSDEDKIDDQGNRNQPNFKPDWNPDLLLSQNYLCHFTAVRTSLVRETGGFRAGFEGSQDHDLFLRCTERLEARRIHHIPKVLYHWRAIPGSTALERQAKDYASSAGLKAVAEHLQRSHAGASVQELPHGHYRVTWPLPEPPPKVSIIVPTRDRLPLLRACVDSVLARTDYPDYEVVVVDNQSAEPQTLAYLDEIQAHPVVRVLRYDHPFNYSAINNWAVSQCEGRVLCLLNNDIEAIEPGWLREMVGHACRPGIGAVGAMLYYPDRTIQHAGVILGIGGVANHAYLHQPAGYPGHGARALVAQNLSAVTGACLVVRRDSYEAIGGLDERLEIAFNDIDFCLRLREAGYLNLWTPFAELCHHESASRGTDDTAEKRQRFQGEVELMQRRWGEGLRHDPAYNPNLTLQSVNFDLAFPPRS